MQEVVDEFFRQNGSVSFVLTIAIETRVEVFSRFTKLYKHQLFVNSNAITDWGRPLKQVFDEVVIRLPPILQTSENAFNEMKWNGSVLRTKPYLGGSHMKLGSVSTEIKISTRELLDLLAGKLDHTTFARNHTFGNESMVFDQMRKGRMMIVASSVERRLDEDDDWITFTFRPGDPAVNLFRAGRNDEEAASKVEK